jgi:hypothetical protein
VRFGGTSSLFTSRQPPRGHPPHRSRHLRPRTLRLRCVSPRRLLSRHPPRRHPPHRSRHLRPRTLRLRCVSPRRLLQTGGTARARARARASASATARGPTRTTKPSNAHRHSRCHRPWCHRRPRRYHRRHRRAHHRRPRRRPPQYHHQLQQPQPYQQQSHHHHHHRHHHRQPPPPPRRLAIRPRLPSPRRARAHRRPACRPRSAAAAARASPSRPPKPTACPSPSVRGAWRVSRACVTTCRAATWPSRASSTPPSSKQLSTWCRSANGIGSLSSSRGSPVQSTPSHCGRRKTCVVRPPVVDTTGLSASTMPSRTSAGHGPRAWASMARRGECTAYRPPRPSRPSANPDSSRPSANPDSSLPAPFHALSRLQDGHAQGARDAAHGRDHPRAGA